MLSMGAIVGLMVLVAVPGAALATTGDGVGSDTYPLEVPDDEVEVVDDEVEVVEDDEGPRTEVAGEGVSRSDDGALPFTGGDVAGLAAIGLVALGAGFGLWRFQRRPAA